MVDIPVLLSLVFFYLLTFLWGMKFTKRTAEKETIQSWVLGDRKMSFFVGVLTMTATWVGGGYLNGTAEAVYSQGLSWTQAPWCYALSLIVGGAIFAKPMRDKGYTTLLDPFLQKHGKGFTSVLFLVTALGDLFWTGAILLALGQTFALVLAIDPSLGIILSAFIAITYTLIGGFRSVASTDVLQLFMILGGLFIAVPFIVDHAGGLQTILEKYDQIHLDGWSLFPFYAEKRGQGLWLDSSLMLILGGIPWGVYFQRVLASPDSKTAKKLSYAAGALCLLFSIPSIIIGAAALEINWSHFGIQPENVAVQVLPLSLKHLVPQWVSIFGLGAICAAVMSSMDSSLLSVSTQFTINVLQPWFKIKKQSTTIAFSRISILFFGVLAVLLALNTKSIYSLWALSAEMVYVLLFPQLVAVLFMDHLDSRDCLLGFLLSLLCRLSYPLLISLSVFDGIPLHTLTVILSLSSMVLISKSRKMIRDYSLADL